MYLSFDLSRFTRAQNADFAGALAEIRSGAKRGHWIWFVFPQLAGLGSSPAAISYGISGAAEAGAYLRDPILRGRLLEITRAVDDQLKTGIPLTRLMGSRIDALKLVSSLTLFEPLARRLHATEANEDYRNLADAAERVLAVAAAQGLPRCQFTVERMKGTAA